MGNAHIIWESTISTEDNIDYQFISSSWNKHILFRKVRAQFDNFTI